MKRRSGLQSSVECRPRLKSFESPSMSSAGLPHARHDAHVEDDVELSVSSMPTFDIGEPSGPITYGTTYIVRPFIEPSKSLPSFA